MCSVTQFGDFLMCDLNFSISGFFPLFQCSMSVSVSEILEHFLLTDSLFKSNNLMQLLHC